VQASFFGTDGIRGKTSLDEVDESEAIARLVDERTLTPAFMRVLGEALSHVQPGFPGEGGKVVIGWDRRPHNPALVEALTLGLRLTGSNVVHIGECATPTLHHAVLAFNARMGCMITASHNPVSDSGIKVFDANGYKSTPEMERDISRTLHQLASEDREVDEVDRRSAARPDAVHETWASKAHGAWLSQRWAHFEQQFGGCKRSVADGTLAVPFLLDCAGGFGRAWLASWLTERGVVCKEVSQDVALLNDGCGAGDLSPTQTWTYDEAAASSHLLLRQLKPAPPGQWVGAALDGDGDRCLLIQATSTGFRVVDGDAMGAVLMAAANAKGWSFAASIESDIALPAFVRSCDAGATIHETAVGDRWLAYALRPGDGGTILAANFPPCLGIEDSGHLILPAPHPTNDQRWSLVGDGAATLCAVLQSADGGAAVTFNRGWKRRLSVNESHRERWHPQADVFETVAKHIETHLKETVGVPVRRLVDGEANLLLVHAAGEKGTASVGIRNSGTQAKTSLSVRLSPGMAPEPFEALMVEIKQLLRTALCDG
jgi:phosphoglucosamine mutase